MCSQFLNGKALKKLSAALPDELTRLEPFFVPSRNFPDRLYCQLTGMLVARTTASAKKHMQGRRFEAARQRFHDDQQELIPEPNLEDAPEDDECEGGGEDEDGHVSMEDGDMREEENNGDEEEEGLEGDEAPMTYPHTKRSARALLEATESKRRRKKSE